MTTHFANEKVMLIVMGMFKIEYVSNVGMSLCREHVIAGAMPLDRANFPCRQAILPSVYYARCYYVQRVFLSEPLILTTLIFRTLDLRPLTKRQETRNQKLETHFPLNYSAPLGLCWRGVLYTRGYKNVTPTEFTM